MLSTVAAAALNTLLMHAADEVVIGDGYVHVLDRPTALEIRGQLQAWRDSMGEPPAVSRALVERVVESLAAVPALCELVAKYPNDAELGGIVRELLRIAPELLRAHILLTEAIAP